MLEAVTSRLDSIKVIQIRISACAQYQGSTPLQYIAKPDIPACSNVHIIADLSMNSIDRDIPETQKKGL